MAGAPHPVFVSVPCDAPHPQRRGLFVTRHRRPIASEMINGIRLASAAETLLAAARDLGPLDIVILGDAAFHLRDAPSRSYRRRLPSDGAVLRCCALLSHYWMNGASRPGSQYSAGCTWPRRLRPSRKRRSMTNGATSWPELTFGSSEPVGCTSTTARRTATKNDTAQTSGANGAWLRLIGSASGSPHRSSSMRQRRSSLRWSAAGPDLGSTTSGAMGGLARRVASPVWRSRPSNPSLATVYRKQVGKWRQVAGLTQAEPRFASTFVGQAARLRPSDDVEGDRRAFRCGGTRSGVGVDNEVDARAVDANPLHLGLEAGLAHHLPSRR